MFEQRGTKERVAAITLTAAIAVGAGGLAVWSMAGDEEPMQPKATFTENSIENGLVSEVFEDCSQWRVLEAGKIVLKNEITCDGGSFIVVEGQRIQTSSGFTLAEDAFGEDISSLDPGDRVNVRFTEDSFGKSLDCDECKINIVQE